MAAYAVGIIGETRFGPEIREYLERIDATLAPHGGKFRVHGGPYETLEGTWQSDLIMIEFPDMEHARQWYGSPAYQAIMPLRAEHTEGVIFLVHGVDDSHRAIDLLG